MQNIILMKEGQTYSKLIRELLEYDILAIPFSDPFETYKYLESGKDAEFLGHVCTWRARSAEAIVLTGKLHPGKLMLPPRISKRRSGKVNTYFTSLVRHILWEERHPYAKTPIITLTPEQVARCENATRKRQVQSVAKLIRRTLKES